GKFHAGGLKFKNEIQQILVRHFFQAEFVSLVPEFHRAFETAMLQGMAHVAVFRANPINAFAVRIWLRSRFVDRFLASLVEFLDSFAGGGGFFFGQLTIPAHFFGNLFFGLVGVAVLFEKFGVFVRPRVAFFQEFFVVVFVPVFLRVLSSALMLF